MRHRYVPGLIIGLAAILASLIFIQEAKTATNWSRRIRRENCLRLQDAAQHVRDYFDAAYALLHFVSADENVIALRPTIRPMVEKLFQHALEQDRLTEVYIVEATFDGAGSPFMSFVAASSGKARKRGGEAGEYLVQTEHLRQFREGPGLKALLSQETLLCALDQNGAPSRGFVYSVPMRSGDKLVGLVAGMLRTATLRDVLGRTPGQYYAALLYEGGAMMGGTAIPRPLREWLENLRRKKSGFVKFTSPGEPVDLPGWVVVSTPVLLQSGERLWLLHVYRKDAETIPGFFQGFVGHVALAGSLLVAAIAVALLVSTLNRRLAEQTRHILERKELERQVQEVSEREKRRAGESLHEDLCQRLTGIQAIARVVERDMAAAHLPGAPLASELSHDLKESLHRALEMAGELQPVALLKDGFVAAVRKLADAFQKRTAIACRVETRAFPEVLDEALATQLYRVLQEALNNVGQHAEATEARIELSGAAERLTLEVGDNGCGFDPTRQKPQGMGLRIMRYRAELAGGEFQFRSAPGQGTTLRVSLPAKPVSRPTSISPG
jgi:signal transduction histidine kinase